MDGDHAPSALNTELLEEGCRDHSVTAGECIRVQQSSADDRNEDDAKPSAKDLGRVSNDGSACHSTEIGNHLCHGHGVGRELELVLEHGWVEILRAVGHEVEACHQKLQKSISMLDRGIKRGQLDKEKLTTR